MSFEFHYDRKKYFQQQYQNTKKYIIPFIEKKLNVSSKIRVLEIGSGEGGVLKAFYELGCDITGIDLAPNKIENANKYFSEIRKSNSFEFFAGDIYDFNFSELKKFDLILLKDTIEHIHDQGKLLKFLAQNIHDNGYIFIAFPPWQMPWGGHQQICDNKIVSLMPYIHLLPNFLYKGILKIFGENDKKINNLMETKETGITIERFERILRVNQFIVAHKIFYLINPNYEIKFGLKPKKQFNIISKIPYIRDLFITTCFYLIRK
ncbi:MAG: class I SAM-dependent methyltransferase [Candidatus Cloacimonetes bacterium]|nr:class I SAM-dependent methyltransferase [Candidatus Cloacimonadota bacterium]MCF7812896.1 class I SAM-dependent methyltransferase [Candidatus Cloacimonadota bacterium]MCF7867108.1 class I SAM-dependent methyltransferase [Candidatus Cloacimonadota bacterium]MCF7882572.1 class I SAM-dependent methyltransferase [Candidatus Cloacimonadota bacterium]